MTTDAAISPRKKSDRMRGLKDGFQHFDLLRAKWPKAFPLRSHEVRPLANDARQTLMEEFGWDRDYAQGVLAAWKMRYAYSQAILHYRTRIRLDGSPSDQEVGDNAREMARTQLERQAVRKAAKAQKERDRQRAAEEESAEPKVQPPETAPLATAEDKRAEEIIEPEVQTPDAAPITPLVIAEEKLTPAMPPKSGKLRLAGSAAMQAALQRRLAGGSTTTEVLKTVPAKPMRARREPQAR